jgi:hypothetical protein
MHTIFWLEESWDSSVGIATGYRLDDRIIGVRFPGGGGGGGIFLFDIMSRLALGPIQPPVQWVPGALSLGVKRPGREPDHLPPSSAEVKNAWSYTSAPQYAFTGWCLVKHRDNFSFILFWLESLKGRDHSEDLNVDDNIRMDLREMRWGMCGLDATGSG